MMLKTLLQGSHMCPQPTPDVLREWIEVNRGTHGCYFRLLFDSLRARRIVLSNDIISVADITMTLNDAHPTITNVSGGKHDTQLILLKWLSNL